MAVFSVNLQRGTFYLLGLLCVLLVYQIFNHGADVVRSSKRSLRFNENSRNGGVEHGGSPGTRNGKRNPPSKHEGENTELRTTDEYNSSRLRESILRKELRALKLRLRTSESTIKLLRQNMKDHVIQRTKLEEEIAQLKGQNVELLAEVESHNYSSSHSDKTDNEENREGSSKHTDISRIANKNISEAIAFQTFSKTHVFEPEYLPKPKEYIFKDQKRDSRAKTGREHIVEMENVALKMINSNRSLSLRRDDIIEGVYRFDVNYGVDYEIYFRDPWRKSEVLSARILRPLTPPQVMLPSMEHKQSNKLINLILPLSGRIERFRQFIDLFIEVCIKGDKNVYLTVVLYGEKDFRTVKRILRDLEDTYRFRKYQLVMRDKQFSRGRALHDGVTYWKGEDPNVLMFFCDVDVTFHAEFLRRCRSFTNPGKQVYYPMVFSLYNPKNVYEDQNIPSSQDQLRIDSKYGFWRIYGFGMTCQYRMDYLKIGGFDLGIEGWGSEDQKLHRMYATRSNMRIIRAPDRDLFHHFHEKYCDPKLKWDQYRACLGSKAKVEGSTKQIAMQLFKLRKQYEPELAPTEDYAGR